MPTEIIAVLAITWLVVCGSLVYANAMRSANRDLKEDGKSWRERNRELRGELQDANETVSILSKGKYALNAELEALAVELASARAHKLTARVQPHHDATGKTTSLTLDLVITRDGVTKFVEVRRLAASKKSRDELTAVAAKINLAAKEMSA